MFAQVFAQVVYSFGTRRQFIMKDTLKTLYKSAFWNFDV